jgi:hypothetical protein
LSFIWVDDEGPIQAVLRTKVALSTSLGFVLAFEATETTIFCVSPLTGACVLRSQPPGRHVLRDAGVGSCSFATDDW